MTKHEAQFQKERLERFNKLTQEEKDCYRVIRELERDRPEDEGCRKTPFSGDTRENRNIRKIEIYFTETQGGAPATDATIDLVAVNAYHFRKWLESTMRERIKEIEEELSKL